jgi:dienelactone hydrolase
MIRAALFIPIILFLQQVWSQQALSYQSKRHHIDQRSLNVVSITPDTPRINADSVYWIEVPTDSGLIHAAIALPPGKGPFPGVIILHGTHGFAEEYVQLARRVARNGMIGIAACWFAERRGAGVRFITPIDCKDAPPLVDLPGEDRFRTARQAINSLVQKVSALRYVQARQVVLFGHSRGAGAALDYVLTYPGKVQGIILNSCGYPPEVTKRAAAKVKVPILMLHGTADSPADGGSAYTSIAMAREFDAALRATNNPIDVNYYNGSGHNGIFTDSTQIADTVQRIVNFVRNRVGK